LLTISRLKTFFLSRFAKPTGDRGLDRILRSGTNRRIVEIGVGDGLRAKQILQLAVQLSGGQGVTYTGIDLFESSAGNDQLGLKQAYKLLRPTGARIQLVPGDPFTALSAMANNLQRTDLLIVSAGVDAESMKRAWFYVPRMLHPGSQIFLEMPGEEAGEPRLTPLSEAEVKQRAVQPRRRAAA
jgi:hypothetical protein